MKNKIAKASGIVFSKKKQILFVFLAIYILLLIILNSAVFFVHRNYDFNKKNYVNNEYVKYIEVSSRKDYENLASELTEDDISVFRDEKFFKGIADISYVYKIRFGIPTNIDQIESIFLTSYSENLSKKILKRDIKEGELFTIKRGIEAGNIELHVPIISDVNGNFVSDKMEKEKFNLVNIQADEKLLELLDPRNEFFLEEKEILRIAKKMNVAASIDKAFFYVEDVTKLDRVVNRLEEMGYNSSYAFKYYDGLSNQISVAGYIFAAMAVMLPIFIGVVLVSIFSTYIKNSVADIAILLHIGYSSKEVVDIYISRFRKMFMYGMMINLITLLIFIAYGANIIVSVVLFVTELILTMSLLYTMNKSTAHYSSKNPIEIIRDIKNME